MRISDENHVGLTKLRGKMISRTGKEATYDDVIAELLKIAARDKNFREP
jgi:hypothetical protein